MIDLSPSRPEYRTSTLWIAVALYIVATSLSVFLGVLGFSEYSRWQYPHEYMPAPTADYAE